LKDRVKRSKPPYIPFNVTILNEIELCERQQTDTVSKMINFTKYVALANIVLKQITDIQKQTFNFTKEPLILEWLHLDVEQEQDNLLQSGETPAKIISPINNNLLLTESIKTRKLKNDQKIQMYPDKNSILFLLRNDLDFREDIKYHVRDILKKKISQVKEKVYEPINQELILSERFPGHILNKWSQDDEECIVYKTSTKVDLDIIEYKQNTYFIQYINVVSIQDILLTLRKAHFYKYKTSLSLAIKCIILTKMVERNALILSENTNLIDFIYT